MFLLIFLLYMIAEVTALVLLAQAIGILWTVAVVLGATVVGFLLFGMQTRATLRQISELRYGTRSPASTVTDTMLVTMGGLLLIVPGLVTTVIGMLLLFPPTRALLRPVILLAVARKYSVAVAAGSAGWGTVRTGRADSGGPGVVDGVVVSEETYEGDRSAPDEDHQQLGQRPDNGDRDTQPGQGQPGRDEAN